MFPKFLFNISLSAERLASLRLLKSRLYALLTKVINFSLFIFLSKNKPEEILKLAVKRMLPSGPLAKKQLSKLKIYKGIQHPHEIQKPKIIEFSKISKKNTLSLN